MELPFIESTLTSMGYKLVDRGEYWQCSALYRGGDNPNALQIYKDSGVWKDYVQNESFFPFKVLLEKTVGKDSADQILAGNILPPTTKSPPISTPCIISNERLFSQDDINDLLPHYSFYNRKGISDSTLSFFRSGMCTGGSMYQRYVFPIFNKFNQIHGAAGRDMSNKSSRPKWKHMGKKTKWAYPLYLKDLDSNELPIFNSIKDSKEVLLVESIGDMLALHENNFKNVLVTFGTSISPYLCSVLMGLAPQKISICLNNDFDKKENVGQTSSIKNFLKLLSWFSSSTLSICLPIKNDFGDMTGEDFAHWEIKKSNNYMNNTLICQHVKKHANQLYSQGKISKALMDNIKYLHEK